MKIIGLFLMFFIASCLPLEAKEKVLDIQEVTSPGGIKAWLVEDNSLPIIALRFSFNGAGSLRNTPEKQGVTQLLSNTMDEGAGDLDSQTFQKELSDNSIALRFSSGRDDFGGSLKTLSRHKEKAFNLLKTALNEPRFDSEPLERMRLANITRIQSSKGKPSWIAARLFNDLAYEGHPYALNSGGTLSSLKAITAEDLNNYRKTWLTKDRLIVSVTGNINAKDLGVVLDNIFGDLPETGKQQEIERVEIQNTNRTYLYEKDMPQTIISAAVPSFDDKDPDYYALLVMNSIFGSGGFGSRLMQSARQDRGLTYSIYASLLKQDFMNGFEISTSTKNESAKEILTIIKEEMTKIANEKVTEEELKDAKAFIIGSLPLSLTSTGNISATLQTIQLDNEPIDYLDHFDDKINAVTAEDVLRASKRIMDPENMLVVMVGKPDGIEDFTLLDTLPNVE